MITVSFERIKDRSNDWTILPRLEVVSDQTLFPRCERNRMNKEDELVQTKVGQIESPRVVSRK
jgi:hypothetical protein